MNEFRFRIEDCSVEVEQYIIYLDDNIKNLILLEYASDDCVYALPHGTYTITYKSYTLKIDSEESTKVYAIANKTIKHHELFVTIYCDGKEKAISLLENFVKDANDHANKSYEQIVQISSYNTNNGGWTNLSNLPSRGIETIYLDRVEKDKIINDVERFHSRKELYKKYGIPYKRIYLFEGPPGTGKTSLIFAIASRFKHNISIINFNQQLDDHMFMKAINRMNDNCILVLEDIDALFATREERTKTNNSSVTFSGLLNMLDGFGRKDKMLVFMTTNHFDRLDDALKRPGRIDYILSFTFCKKEQIKEMYSMFFPDQYDRFDKFYDKLSPHKVTIALLQKFFFDNLECDDIITKIPELVKLIDFYKKSDKNLYL